jgi:hypothetical protein
VDDALGRVPLGGVDAEEHALGAVAAGLEARVHAHRARLGGLDGHAGPFHLGEQAHQAVLVRDGQGDLGEELLQGLGGVIGHRADVAPLQVEHGERLEDVADLGLLEGKRQRGVALHGALALEVADAVFVEHDAGDGEGGHGSAPGQGPKGN